MIQIISGTYKYIDPDSGLLPLTLLIWALFGGFIAGMIMTFYNKMYVGETVRRLLKREALSEDSALTLEELGLKPTKLRTGALKDERLLSKYVAIANREDAVTETVSGGKRKRVKKTYDFAKAKLYIREDKKYQADVRFEQKGKPSVLWPVILTVVFAATAVFSSVYVNRIIQMLDNFLQSIL